MRYKLTIIIVVCVLLVAGSILESVYLSKAFETLEEKLDKIMKQEEYDYEMIVETAEWWRGKAEVLEIFVSVVQLNEISVTFGELVGAVKNEDYDSASALLDRIYCYSISIKDMYLPHISNIL